MRTSVVVTLLLMTTSATGATAELLTANPAVIEAAGLTQVSAPSFLDSGAVTVTSWTWSDNGIGGSFWPSNTAQNPLYTAPGNLAGELVARSLTCTMTWVYGWQSGTATQTVLLWELPLAHSLEVSLATESVLVLPSGATILTASAVDSNGHAIVWWAWSDNGAGGIFTEGSGPLRTYYAPATAGGVLIKVTATCDHGASGSAYLSLVICEEGNAPESFPDVTASHWAYEEIMACARAGIVTGYSDGLFRPDAPVTRDQLAVFFARALRLIP